MEKVIAVFNNRNYAMQFASLLKRIGIASKTINSPRELSVSCGVSIVFARKNLPTAKGIIEKYGIKPYVKIYVSDNMSMRGYSRVL